MYIIYKFIHQLQFFLLYFTFGFSKINCKMLFRWRFLFTFATISRQMQRQLALLRGLGLGIGVEIFRFGGHHRISSFFFHRIKRHRCRCSSCVGQLKRRRRFCNRFFLFIFCNFQYEHYATYICIDDLHMNIIYVYIYSVSN